MTQNNYDAAYGDLYGYNQEVTEELNATASDQFIPSLDALVASIRVE
ncbi:hypothetical protein ACFLYO_03125 [Chloroflexota bacterium]